MTSLRYRNALLLAVLLLVASAPGFATPIMFQLTDTPAPPVLFASSPGGFNSMPFLWNFAALPNWDKVYQVTKVEFRIVLAGNLDQNPDSFAYQFADTLSTLFGPDQAIPAGVGTLFTTLGGQEVLDSILQDGIFTTLLMRDPGGSEPGGAQNAFIYLASTVLIEAEAVPEPSTALLGGLGLIGLAFGRRFLRRR